MSSHKAYVSPEEYLAFERNAEYKNEYLDGEVRPMIGASRSHCLIAGNVLGELATQLKGSVSEVYPSRMRVKIPAANYYIYPDVVAVRREPVSEDDYFDTLLNPTLLVEVFSKAAAAFEQIQRFACYRMIESLKEYVLVARDEYRVEQYTKQSDGRWLITDLSSPEERTELASVGCTLALKDIYEGVEF